MRHRGRAQQEKQPLFIHWYITPRWLPAVSEAVVQLASSSLMRRTAWLHIPLSSYRHPINRLKAEEVGVARVGDVRLRRVIMRSSLRILSYQTSRRCVAIGMNA